MRRAKLHFHGGTSMLCWRNPRAWPAQRRSSGGDKFTTKLFLWGLKLAWRLKEWEWSSRERPSEWRKWWKDMWPTVPNVLPTYDLSRSREGESSTFSSRRHRGFYRRRRGENNKYLLLRVLFLRMYSFIYLSHKFTHCTLTVVRSQNTIAALALVLLLRNQALS